MTVLDTAPALRGPAIFDQYWCDLTFLHWPVDPAAVARFMPPGVRPDVFDGVSYVGLVPFQMKHAAVGPVPAPYFGSFAEVNVRLYSVDDRGRHGVVFCSLDADRAAVVGVARMLGVPYVWSRIAVSRYRSTRERPINYQVEAPTRRYAVRRRSGLSSRVEVSVGERVTATPLEVFLTARWGMHSAFAGRSLWTPNKHESWPLHATEVTGLDDQLVGSHGIEPIGPMLRPLWSPGVHSQFGRPVGIATEAYAVT